MFEQLFQQAPIGFAVIDRRMRYVRINEHLAAINGRPVDEHLGRSIDDVIPAASAVLGPLLEQVFTTGRPLQSLELEAATPAEPTIPRWWLLSFFPICDSRQNVEFVGVTALEVTKRKTIELSLAENEERLELATEASGVGVWEWRLASNEMIYSPQAKLICGFDPDAPVSYEMVASVTHP